MIFKKAQLTNEEINSQCKLWLRSHFPLPYYKFNHTHRSLWRQESFYRRCVGFFQSEDKFFFGFGIQLDRILGSHWPNSPTSCPSLCHIRFQIASPLQIPMTHKDLKTLLKLSKKCDISEILKKMQDPNFVYQLLQEENPPENFHFFAGGTPSSLNRILIQSSLLNILEKKEQAFDILTSLRKNPQWDSILVERIELAIQDLAHNV